MHGWMPGRVTADADRGADGLSRACSRKVGAYGFLRIVGRFPEAADTSRTADDVIALDFDSMYGSLIELHADDARLNRGYSWWPRSASSPSEYLAIDPQGGDRGAVQMVNQRLVMGTAVHRGDAAQRACGAEDCADMGASRPCTGARDVFLIVTSHARDAGLSNFVGEF